MSILPPIRIEFVEKESEHVTGSLVPMHLKMTTFLPEEGEEVMFTSCSDVPYEIKLSDEENFEVINRSSRFNKHIVLRDADSSYSLSVLLHIYCILLLGSNDFKFQIIFRQD